MDHMSLDCWLPALVGSSGPPEVEPTARHREGEEREGGEGIFVTKIVPQIFDALSGCVQLSLQ